MDLNDAVVIVTGASMGIGEALARAFAAAGARLTLAARSTGRLQQIAGELNSGGLQRALAVTTDMGDAAAVERLVQETVAAWGRVDVLVNNAGYGLYAPLADAPLTAVRALMDVNYFGALQAVQAVVPHMRRQKRGAIVNVASIVGRHVTPQQGAYCASKYALIAASDAWRMELAPQGITVLTVLPGVTRSAFQQNALQVVPPPRRPGVARGVAPDRVAQATLAAVRRGGPPEVYVTLFDRAYVTFAVLFPRFTDRVLLYLLARRRDRPGQTNPPEH